MIALVGATKIPTWWTHETGTATVVFRYDPYVTIQTTADPVFIFAEKVEKISEEFRRWLSTYALWVELRRAERRVAFFAQRLKEQFVVRDVRPHRRACSGAARWMVTR